jgi:hypothetical protein
MAQDAVAHLRSGGQVVWHSDIDGLDELESGIRVTDQKTAGADSMWPHVEGLERVVGESCEIHVRGAKVLEGGTAILTSAHGQSVAATTAVFGGTLVVCPDVRQTLSFKDLGRDTLVECLYGVKADAQDTGVATQHIPVVGAFLWDHDASHLLGLELSGEEVLKNARRMSRQVPENVFDAVSEFAEQPHRSGALLLRGCPVGDVPLTPLDTNTPDGKIPTSELTLLSVARMLGFAVGYAPEHGGDIIQNILPLPQGADRQVSTSSKTTLMYHTEASFHPLRPRWLLLLCLRGDASAKTTLVSVHDILPRLSETSRRVLSEPRFETGIDESYAGVRSSATTAAHSVLWGTPSDPHMLFDADLTKGRDADAVSALEELNQVIAQTQGGAVLESGDLLVVDNTVAIHGRSPFKARFDGTDRWLQRTFVVADLASCATELRGRIIDTRFKTL